MDISLEKEFLYEMMKEVMMERRELTDIYYSLKKRLDQLSEMEEKGLKDLSIEGYVELHNKVRGKLEVENRRRELAFQEKKLEAGQSVTVKNQVEIIQDARKEVEGIPAEQLSESVQLIDEPKVNISREDIVRTKAASEVIETNKRRRTPMSDERAAGIVAEVLKDAGIPVKFDVIYDGFLEKAELEPGEIKKSSFRTNTFRRILEINPKIQRVSGMRGFYQYMH